MEKIIEDPNVVYLLEEFELEVIKKIIAYIKTEENPSENLKREHDYFGKHLKDSLLKKCVAIIHAHQEKLPGDEMFNWLTISCRQAKDSPGERFEIWAEKFLQEYFSPFRVPEDGKDLEFILSLVLDAVSGYIKHYPTFVDVMDQSLDAYKKRYYGLEPIPNPDQSSKSKKKLKTNLTVKEIAYLFRALHDEGIIESRQKTDLFNFIAENFSSKQKDEVSANSIKNAFDTPDVNAVDFWQGKFIHLMQKSKKDKEK